MQRKLPCELKANRLPICISAGENRHLMRAEGREWVLAYFKGVIAHMVIAIRGAAVKGAQINGDHQRLDGGICLRTLLRGGVRLYRKLTTNVTCHTGDGSRHRLPGGSKVGGVRGARLLRINHIVPQSRDSGDGRARGWRR